MVSGIPLSAYLLIFLFEDMTSYEVAYLLNPEITPEDVVTVAGGITQAIEKIGGSVQYVTEPKKRKLAFFVGKAAYAYFGYTDFAIEPKKVSELRKILALDQNILRFLIVYALKINAAFKEKPYFGRGFRKNAKIKEDAVLKHPKPAESQEPKVTSEEIDRKLEEILNT